MKKLHFAIMIIIFLVSVCWLGSELYSVNKINDRLTEYTKGDMVNGILDTQRNLETGFESIVNGNAGELDEFYWAELKVNIDKVLSSTKILEKS